MNTMLLRIIARLQDQQGQALAEYGLIVGLIAVAAIVAMGLLGTALAGKFGELTDALP